MRKKILTLSVAALIGIGSFSGTVFAETEQDLKANQNSVKNERADVLTTLSQADKEIASVLYDLDALNDKVTKTTKALETNQAKLDETKTNIATSQKEIEQLRKDIEKLKLQIEKRFSILKDRLVAYQQSGGDIAFLDVLAGSQNFSEFVSRAKAVSDISQSDIKLMEQLEKDQKEVEKKKKTVNEKLTAQKEEKADLEGVQQTIEDQKKQQEANKLALENKQTELNDKKASLQMKDSELTALESKIGTEIAEKRSAAEQAAKQSAEKTVASASTSDNETTVSNSGSTGSTSGSNSASVSVSKPKHHKTHSSSNGGKKQTASAAPAQTGNLSAAINAGYGVIGTPYVWGGKSPGGFDCSGFVSWAYRQAGISVPSSTSGLQSVGTAVSYSNAKPGDMVFFNTYKTNGHVGIYLGGGKFIGAQDSGLDVANMNSGYWKQHFSGHVRRIR